VIQHLIFSRLRSNGDPPGHHVMTISALDLFKIGIGPSSSHTVGPMRAACAFTRALRQAGLMDAVRRIQVRLYGSLAATGVGHGTDRAVVAGLMGIEPDQADPDAMAQAVDSRSTRIFRALSKGGFGRLFRGAWTPKNTLSRVVFQSAKRDSARMRRLVA